MTYNEKWGEPQGNEVVWGRLIVRMLGPGKFKKVAYFHSYLDANASFESWMKENNTKATIQIDDPNSIDLLTITEFVHRTR